jgi:uncharacterized membrane-anchored protein
MIISCCLPIVRITWFWQGEKHLPFGRQHAANRNGDLFTRTSPDASGMIGEIETMMSPNPNRYEEAMSRRIPEPDQIVNKVPLVTAFFWVIKILCTTVGETAADLLNDRLHLGLTGTTVVMGILLIVALAFQFRAKSYVPLIYWASVVLISIVGTLITDNLTDRFGISLVVSTSVFSVLLAVVFVTWYLAERTLSIHRITTTRREAFYWLTVLCTFALGTAAGDLVAERLNVGYWRSIMLFGILIAAVAIAHLRFGLNAVVAFWIAYVLTRPLGASIGDFLSQPTADGGVNLGTVGTSALFLVAIVGLVIYLTLTRTDALESASA